MDKPSTCLWIDDEISTNSPEVQFMIREDMRVDCAVTAATGIDMAHSRKYEMIVLDLRLPDGSDGSRATTR